MLKQQQPIVNSLYVNVRFSESQGQVSCHIIALHSLIKNSGLGLSTVVNNSSACAVLRTFKKARISSPIGLEMQKKASD